LSLLKFEGKRKAELSHRFLVFFSVCRIVRQEPSAQARKVLVRVARELQQLVNIANRGEMLSVEL